VNTAYQVKTHNNPEGWLSYKSRRLGQTRNIQTGVENRATAASLAGCGTLRQHCRGVTRDDFGDYAPAWYVAAAG
jgi:hypothetical protein